MKPVIDHVHITVADLGRAEAFYDRLLPLLGFDLRLKERDSVPEHDYQIVEYHNRAFSFGIVSPRLPYAQQPVSRRRPGALHHLAFRAENPEEVDRLYHELCALDVPIVHAPQLYPEYAADYYAFFFKDSEGIEYEIVSFAREHYFPQP